MAQLLCMEFREAKGKYMIVGDSDDSYDFSKLDLFIEKLREGYDLVMGNRFKGGIKMGQCHFCTGILGILSFRLSVENFFNSNIGDFHCGLRGFNQNILQRLKLQTTGMEFASEMIVNRLYFN